MIETRFNEWLESHPQLESHIIPKTPHWGRLICAWNEQQTHARLRHFYVATIDRRSGAVYFDCSPLKIALKCLGLAILYPIELTIRTVYLICFPVSLPIDIGCTIYYGIKEELPARKICQRVAQRIYRNVMDCLRTPVYATTLSLVCLASCFILINPNHAYDLRALIGRIEASYRWGDLEKVTAPCFQPSEYFNVEGDQKEYPDTVYDGDDAVLQAMSNFARSKIRFWQSKHNLCVNGCILPHPGKAYVTPGYAYLLG